MLDLSPQSIRPFIRSALKEDAAFWDATSRAVLPKKLRVHARIVAKAPGVTAGINVAALTFTTVDSTLRCRLHRHDGERLVSGATILTVEGRVCSIFAAERVALNFLGHLCGVATLTAEFVRRTKNTHAKIFDTRKTLPGLRLLEKYAVRAGGGYNHRMDLRDAILIKTNHILADSVQRSAFRKSSMPETIQHLVKRAKRSAGKRFVEVEVRNLQEFRAAIAVDPDAILLDNWKVRDIRKAVALRSVCTLSTVRCTLEVSGGVTLGNVHALAKTGVDRISIGRLTHSAPSLDVSLEIVR